MLTPGPMIGHDYDSTKTRQALSRVLDQRLDALGLWRLRTPELVLRMRGSSNDPQIVVRYPATKNPTDITFVEKEHSLDEGLKLIAADDGPEAELAKRTAAAKAAAEAQRAAAQLSATEAKVARWRQLPRAARAVYRVAHTCNPQHRNVLLELARAIANEPADPDDAPHFVTSPHFDFNF